MSIIDHDFVTTVLIETEAALLARGRLRADRDCPSNGEWLCRLWLCRPVGLGGS